MNNRPWQPREDEELRRRCGKESIKNIAHDLGRTECAVVKRVYRLGLSLATKNMHWTTLEDRLVVKLVEAGLPYSVIATKLERTTRAVMQRYYEKLRENKQG